MTTSKGPTVLGIAEPWGLGQQSNAPDISQSSVARWIGVDPKPLEFAIHGIAPKAMVTLLVAPGGGGKTLLLQASCTCIAAGIPFLGRATSIGTAAALFAEDPENVLHIRQLRIDEAYDVELPKIADRLLIQSSFGQNVVLWKDGAPTSFFQELRAQLLKIPNLQLVVLDNAALLFAGNENDRVEVTQFMNLLNGLAAEVGAAIILSTHQSKSRREDNVAFASGSTAWINAARSALELQPAQGDKPAQLILRKANHVAPGAAIELVWQNGVLLPVSSGASLDHLGNATLDDTIFNEVEKAWRNGLPLSLFPQAKGREISKRISSLTGRRALDVKGRVEYWLASDHLLSGQKVSQTARAPSGLKVAKWPPKVKCEPD